ncbi:zinc-ribbon domain-containing protein [bacterium]|nr:zinc-ribbon domain-containing protein [bacterium]
MYCTKCGAKLNEGDTFCHQCGNRLINNTDESDITNIICAIIGLTMPIVGAVLYYVFKKSNPKAAKTANVCSWIGFLVQTILLIIKYYLILY